MDLSPPGDRAQTNPRPQEPTIVQIDPKCLHSALKEFFDPLRTNDSRADFFAIYRRESEEFDRDYAGKYDEDLNTSLIFAGLFSAVSSAFIIDVQSNLQPNPNEMTAAYMRILIHNMNNSLFPDADPSSTTWTGPPPEIVTVQSLLYSSLATSLFAAFIAMLGKQWVNRYLRKQGGSAAEKSRDRQRKLDGFKKWHFQLVIESLPVMLQFALLLLGCALTLYLWTISRTVAGTILAFTLLGMTSYVFFTLAAMFHYNCPYQTPPSILIRTLIRHLAQSDSTFVRSLRLLASSLPPAKDIRRLLGYLLSGVRQGLKCFCCGPTMEEEAERLAQSIIVVPPTRIFSDVSVNLEVCRGDSCCIWWVLDYTTDTDVIFSTARFAADTIWYPEIAEIVSPHILADLFFDCFLNGQVIPGKLEHASAIGMALTSVLSTRLVIEPKGQELRELCRRIWEDIERVSLSDPTCLLVIRLLGIVAGWVDGGWNEYNFRWLDIGPHMVCHLSATKKLWLSRVALQYFWRLRLLHGPTTVLSLYPFSYLDEGGIIGGGNTPIILQTNNFLIVAISLGLQVDNRDLDPPDTIEASQKVADLVIQQLQIIIRQGNASEQYEIIDLLSALVHLNPFGVTQNEDMGFTLIADILSSSFSDRCRYLMGSKVLQLLGTFLFPGKDRDAPLRPLNVELTWITPLLAFLSLSEKLYTTEPPPYPGSIALRILSTARIPADFGAALIPVLSSTLLPTHPLQSRHLALNVFNTFFSRSFSLQIENTTVNNLENVLQAVGDPFLSTHDASLLDVKTREIDYGPFDAAIVLIEFASSDLWRNHLHPSNFATFEELLSLEEGKRTATERMFIAAVRPWQVCLCAAAKVYAAIGRLEELQCLNVAEFMIMWAWTVGILNVEDRDGWGSIERSTLLFYQLHGIGRLKALERHITTVSNHADLFLSLHGGPLNRLAKVQLRGSLRSLDWGAYLRISQVCQLRRLYFLFGRNSTTREEAVEIEGAGKETDLLSAVTSTSILDWTCDYP